MVNLSKDKEVGFWSKVLKADNNQCWLWQGKVGRDGYGRFSIKRQTWARAHRIAFQLANGILDSNLFVLHSCDVRRCCNPEHLRQGTAQDNADDRERRGRSRTPSRMGVLNGRTKLSVEEVLYIRQASDDGVSRASLSRRFGVTEACIFAIAKRKNWRSI